MPGRVDEHVLELDVGIVRPRRAARPRARAVTSRARSPCRRSVTRARRVAQQARTRAGAIRSICARRVLAACRRRMPSGRAAAGAVVEAADELADDQQVDARRLVRGTEVRVDVESVGERSRSCSGRTGAPSSSGRPTSAEEDGVAPGTLERPLGQRRPFRSRIARPPKLCSSTSISIGRARRIVDRHRCHLRADSVSGQRDDAQQHQGASSRFVSESRVAVEGARGRPAKAARRSLPPAAARRLPLALGIGVRHTTSCPSRARLRDELEPAVEQPDEGDRLARSTSQRFQPVEGARRRRLS